MHQASGDEETPPHASRQAVQPSVGPLSKTRDSKRSLDGFAALSPGYTVKPGKNREILPGRQLDVEVVDLRDDADFCAHVFGLFGKAVAEHLKLTLVRDSLSGQHAHRCRLPGAVWPK